MLSPTTTPTSVSGTSVSLTLSQPSDSLSVDMYSVVFTSTACPNIESRSASTTTNSLTVDNLEAGVLYSYTLTGANTVAELNGTTTSTTTTMETGISLELISYNYHIECDCLATLSVVPIYLSEQLPYIKNLQIQN